MSKYLIELFDIRLPTCKPNHNYTAAFKSSMNTPESIEIIESLQKLRDELFQTLTRNQEKQDVLRIIDQYLPTLCRLNDSLLSTEKFTPDCDIVFEWSGSFVLNMQYFTSSDTIYEMIMILHTKAMTHYLIAKELVDTDVKSFAADAGKHLLVAAGIFDYLGTQLNHNWNKIYNIRAPNPVELNPLVNDALSILCKTNAQTLSVLKALNNNEISVTTPANIIARLSLGVMNTAQRSVEQLSRVTAILMNSSFVESAAMAREVFAGIAHMHLCQHYAEKHECGIAIGHGDVAKVKFTEQSGKGYNFNLPGMVPLTGSRTVLKPVIQEFITKINEMQKKSDMENRMIYFQPVPNELPELPLEACVMNPVPFQLPVYSQTVVNFDYKPEVKASMVDSVFSMFRSKSSISENSTVSASDNNSSNGTTNNNTANSGTTTNDSKNNNNNFTSSANTNPGNNTSLAGISSPAQYQQMLAQQQQQAQAQVPSTMLYASPTATPPVPMMWNATAPLSPPAAGTAVNYAYSSTSVHNNGTNTGNNSGAFKSDEEYARELQRQFNAETAPK